MTNKETILDNSPFGWVITMLATTFISVIWFFVMVKHWPYAAWIGWSLFAVPVSITVLLPLMYVIRKVQARRKNK